MRRIVLLFVMFLLVFSMVSCTLVKNEINCCQQCLDAASQDPAGYDISIKECSRYELSPKCTQYFEQNEVRVGECREVKK